MNTLKIFNLYQADFLIKNGCVVRGTGLEGKAYILFLVDKTFDNYMQVWKERKH